MDNDANRVDQSDAANYDRWFETRWGRYAAGVETAVIARAVSGFSGVRHVLDAGCGTGRFTAALTKGVGPGATVVGVDPDQAMLEIARHRIANGTCRGVVEALPFDDDTFDVTAAITVLEFVSEPVTAVDELVRVTRAGGHIIIGTLNPRSPWGIANRRRLRTGVWCTADLLPPNRLLELGRRYGKTELHRGLYAPGALRGHTVIGPVLEGLRHVTPSFGAFQVLVITAPGR